MRCKTCKKEQWVSLDDPGCKECQLRRELLERRDRLLKLRRDTATPFSLYQEMALVDLKSTRLKKSGPYINLSDPGALAYQTPCDQETLVSGQYERRIVIHDGDSRFFWGTFDIEYDNYNIIAMDEHPLQRFINNEVRLSLPINCSKISMYNADGKKIKEVQENHEERTILYPSYKGKISASYWVYIVLVGNDRRYVHYRFGNIWLKGHRPPSPPLATLAAITSNNK